MTNQAETNDIVPVSTATQEAVQETIQEPIQESIEEPEPSQEASAGAKPKKPRGRPKRSELFCSSITLI